MEVLKAIYTRRSIRRYSDKEVARDLVEKIIHAGMFAPSAVNKQPWHFITFTEEEPRKVIQEVHPSSGMLSQAHVCIIVCYDEKLQHDEGYGVIDCSACTQNMLLAAHDFGLGACWVGITPREKRIKAIKDYFQLPTSIIPFAIVALGYPAEEKNQPDRILPQRIHHEKW